MANEGDRIEVQFTQTEALAQELLNRLEQDIAQAQAIGDEMEVARLRAKRVAISGGQYTREAPAIQEDTAALERENIIRRSGLGIEKETLQVLRQQLAARLETQAAGARLAAPAGMRFGGSYEQLAGQQVAREQAQAAAATLAEEQRITQELRQQAVLREESLRRAGQVGYGAGARGQLVPQAERQAIITGPQGGAAERIGGNYTEAEQRLAHYNMALGEYQGFASRAGSSTQGLMDNITRLGVVQSREADVMRRHGALTTEWLGALARGETTVAEFGYQIGATVGKFAGWTAAATATFAALGILTEFGKGAIDASHGVGMLSRTIDNLNTDRAAVQIRQLSQETNVSVHDASDAMFRFSRTFHDQNDAAEAARLGISVYKLDQVSLQDSVRTSTALHQQYGLGLRQLGTVYDMLAAGQREYNARIQDMVPLLQKSSGAVKNAGGDLTQLIQLGTVGLRLMPGLGGAQLGTALYRAAATQTMQHAGDLTTQFGLGRDINPLTGQMNFTQLLMDAIRESRHLSQPQRQQLATDIFGRQYGGRTAAFFTPESAQLLDQVTGRTRGPQGPITPAGTRGSLGDELSKLLGTTREQLDHFVNSMQRLGGALAQSGALAPLGLLLRFVISAADAFTGLLNEFDRLPGTVRDVISAVVELRLAMLFFSRTRFGSSMPGITRIPGFRPSEATLARAELSTGTRAALQEVETNITRTTAQSLATGAERLELEKRRAALVAEAGGEERMTAAQLERSNAMSARIAALQRQQTALEAEQAAQEAARVGLREQMVGLTAVNRNSRMADADVLAMRDRTAPRPPGGMSPGGVVLPPGVERAEQEAMAVEERSVAQAGILGRSKAAVERTGGAVKNLGSRIGGFAQALDPLTAGLLVLPFVFEAAQTAIDRQNKALENARKAVDEPVASAQDLFKQAQQLRAQAGQMPHPTSGGGLFHDIVNFGKMAGVGFGQVTGIHSLQHLMDPSQAAQTSGQAEQLNAIGTFYDHAAKKFADDAPALIKTAEGQRRMYALSQTLRARMQRVLQGQGFSQAEIDKIYGAFSDKLQKEYEALLAKPGTDPRGGGINQQFARYAQVLAKPLETRLQGLDDRAKLFGTQGPDLRQAALAYAALVNRSRDWTDSTQLQAVASSQQSFVNAVNKNVQDLMHAATMSTTLGGQQANLRRALGVIDQSRQEIEQAFKAAIDYAKQHHEGAAAIQKLQYAEQQMLNNLADQHKQVVDQLLQAVQAQSDQATSRIQGISPEADLARARSTLGGLQNKLAVARANGADAQTIAQLMTQINNSQTELLKQTTQNAQAISDAQGQLMVSSITGISPADDIARARAGVAAAQQHLGFVTGHGLGQAAILQAQSNLFDQERSLNQAIQSENQRIEQDARGFVEATAALRESQTLDPVKQAREQLQADIQALGFIKPQDYRTYQEYQTALLQQKAKIGQDRRTVTQQLFDTDMANLQFELHTQRITDQQYIDGLYKLLQLKKLTRAERRQVLSAIFDETHQQAVDLNVGNIRMPTSYEVRSAIARHRAGHRPGPESATATFIQAPTTNRVSMVIYVDSKRDPHIRAVTDAVNKALNQVSGQAAAAQVTT